MKDLPWQDLSSDLEKPHISSWSLDRPCRRVVARPALQCLLRTRPSPVRSPLLRSLQREGIHLTPGEILVWNPGAKIMSSVSKYPIPRGPRLGSLGYLDPSLRLILFGRDTSALFHHILPLLLPFPLFVCRLRLRVMRNGERGVFTLTDYLGCLAPSLRLHDL